MKKESVAVSAKEQKKIDDQAKFNKDKNTAEKLMKAYAEFKKDKDQLDAKINGEIAAVKEKYKEQLSKIVVPMEAAANDLIAIGERNTKHFIKNRLTLEHGYLLRSFTSIPKIVSAVFDQAKFVKKFPQLVTVNFNIKQLKETLLDSQARSKVTGHGVDITEVDTIKIKVSDKLDNGEGEE